MTTLKNHKIELLKLYKLREDIRNAILGNDYYIAKELRDLESKVIERIKLLQLETNSAQRVI